MSEMEMRFAAASTADRALRDEIMDRFFMPGFSSPAIGTKHESLLSTLLNARSFRA